MKIAEKLREISDAESTDRRIQESIKKEPHMTPPERANALGMHRSTVYDCHKRHGIPIIKKVRPNKRIAEHREKARQIIKGMTMSVNVNVRPWVFEHSGHVYIMKPVKPIGKKLWACEMIEYP